MYHTHVDLIQFPAFFIGGVQFGPAYVPSYLFTAILASIVTIALAFREAERKKVDKRQIWHLCLFTGISGFFFARVFYLLFYYNVGFVEKFFLFFNFNKSGIASFGGVFGIMIGLMLYNRFKKVNILRLADVAVVGLMLGQFIARIGCLLAGCCYGREIVNSCPWAIEFKEALRHPTQAYDALNALFVFFVINRLKYKKYFDGAIFLLTFTLYSFFRFIIEFFRENKTILGLTYNHYFYGILFIACGLIFIHKWKKSKLL